MAYQALYRKYRSQRFDEMVGQEVVATTLKNAIVNHKFHMLIFFLVQEEQGKPLQLKFLPRQLTALIKWMENLVIIVLFVIQSQKEA